MPPIVAPKPLRPTAALPSTSPFPVFPLALDDPFASQCRTPKRDCDVAQFPRLLSPIRIDRGKRHLMTKSPTPCSSIKRPTAHHPPRTPRRRRHYTRPLPELTPVHPPLDFEALPWLSALNADPTDDPWDIADLSQLPIATGPTRRRKTVSAHRRRAEAVVPLVSPRRAAATPPPRFPRPADVAFWNLMPVTTPPLVPSSP
ncbi:hypothetical protein BV25DRAFT_275672 [Artomyces pyxidatus]|uniref:Uncharacterized protein n=1 Tax=Artomyces pyxidatus TaxID=48021 RepID=A0ACB8T7X3_9AGAM|nr:hypothetical protein BV25DRAFT_275672 [Artomyces pyxidatus]